MWNSLILYYTESAKKVLLKESPPIKKFQPFWDFIGIEYFFGVNIILLLFIISVQSILAWA